MANRDWSALDWSPIVQPDIMPRGSVLRDIGGQTDMYGVPQWYWDKSYRVPYQQQNEDLFRSMGFTGNASSQVMGNFGDETKINPELYKWLSDNGISEAVAHDPNTSPGSGRPEYFAYVDKDGKLLQGQADPTMIMADSTMDNITPFLMMAGPFLNAAGVLGAGAEAGAAGLAQSTPDVWGSIQSGALKGGGMGAIKGLATGENPLTSALKGAVTGGVGGGISSIGQGALGSMFGADPGSMDIIPGSFGDAGDYVSQNVMDGVSSLGDAAGGLDGGMGWSDFVSRMDPFGGSMAQAADLGSFADPGFDWNVANLGTPSMNFGGDILQSLGSFADSPVDLGSGLSYLDNLPQASYSNEGRNYSGPGAIDPVGNSPAYTENTPFIDLSGGGLSGALSGLGNIIKPIADAVGGGKNLAGLVGAGVGALSGGSTQTKTNEPWAPAQPFLKNALGDLDAALTSLRQNPYTPQQQSAYNNANAGLDQARATLPGLLSWGQGAMQRQSTTPSYSQLFGGGLLGQQPAAQAQQGGPTVQAGGVGGLLGNTAQDRLKALMVRGGGLLG